MRDCLLRPLIQQITTAVCLVTALSCGDQGAKTRSDADESFEAYQRYADSTLSLVAREEHAVSLPMKLDALGIGRFTVAYQRMFEEGGERSTSLVAVLDDVWRDGRTLMIRATAAGHYPDPDPDVTLLLECSSEREQLDRAEAESLTNDARYVLTLTADSVRPAPGSIAPPIAMNLGENDGEARVGRSAVVFGRCARLVKLRQRETWLSKASSSQ